MARASRNLLCLLCRSDGIPGKEIIGREIRSTDDRWNLAFWRGGVLEHNVLTYHIRRQISACAPVKELRIVLAN